MMSNNFGEILKNIRKERGLTATKLSKMLGISQSNLCKIETGKTKKIDYDKEKFYKEFKNLMQEAVKALGHKYDEIGKLTDAYIPKEAEELKHIRAIYETIIFAGKTINYYDYIAKVYRSVNIYNTVEIQYMVMNLYAKAYTESVLWLEKEDPSGQWCPATPWQIIVKLKIMIPEYFVY